MFWFVLTFAMIAIGSVLMNLADYLECEEADEEEYETAYIIIYK